MPEENNGEKPEVKSFTQDEVNAFVAEAKRKEREKIPTDYDDLKAKAEKFDQLEQESKSELQKALDKVTALEADLNSYKQKEQVSVWADEITKDSDVPASLLRGSTKEELQAHFEQLKEQFESRAPKQKRSSAPAGHPTGEQGSRAVAALRQLGLGGN